MKKLVLFLLALVTLLAGCQQEKRSETKNSIPYSLPEFKGKIGKSFADSEEDFPQPYRAAEGSPNIILIMLDDVGFGQPSTFGGKVATPALDALADDGIKYTHFHTTGVCTPTRAALFTGRNHHEVSFGTTPEFSNGYPGYNNVWTENTASFAEVLRLNGYNTGIWGKWHNTPEWEMSATGPFDRWPTGMGFEYYYGFQGGETNQFEPDLYRNTTAVTPPKTAEEGYHLTEDLAEDAIKWLRNQRALDADKPYFMYIATGATHAPLQVPKEWIDKFKGQFDDGWDVYREHVLAQQIKMGVVPENTVLSPRHPEMPKWDDMSDDQKRLYARQMETFAGFLAHTDYYVGKIIEEARKQPGGENTAVIYIAGDNGASSEGGFNGTDNTFLAYNGFPASVEEQLAHIEGMGSKEQMTHYAMPWAWAGSTPFQWMKRVASHFGATRNGMVISWPAGIEAKNEIRTQFHHVSDIAPTIYEIAGIQAPDYVHGAKQTPISGVSMAYTFENAEAKDRRTTQYFEISGHRGIYHEGWVAGTYHKVPWNLTGSTDFEDDVWELYNIDEDFSQAHDLANVYPEKLEELKKLFDEVGHKYSVFPLDDRFAERVNNPYRPHIQPGRKSFTLYPGMDRIPEPIAPSINNRSYTITAELDYKSGDEGVLVSLGGRSGGYAMYIKDNRAHFHYNFQMKERYQLTSAPLPVGKVEIKVVYTHESTQYGGGGTAKLLVNGKVVNTCKFKRTVPVRFGVTGHMDIGKNLVSPVSTDYQIPFKYNGSFDFVRFDLN